MQSNTCSDIRDDLATVFDGLDAVLDRVLGLSFEALTARERVAVLARCERIRCRLPVVEHALLNEVSRAEPVEIGGAPVPVLADRLRITRTEARRRFGDAAELGGRRALTGQPLAPVLAATAAAQRAGLIGAGHVRVIREFFGRLPARVDAETRERAETDLARLAGTHRPDELAKVADRLMDALNPDGDFADTDRARRRGVTIGRQEIDGMSPIKGYLTPEARATLDAVLARWAAPGMCNPEDATPCVDGTPSPAAITGDRRSPAQRNHDAVAALGRAMLASGTLGQHNGLPTSIVVSVELAELESATGKAITGGGSWLPMTDVIRMAAHAHHYLRIHTKSKEVALFHTRRIATAGQRIVLHARDRGCSFPGCPMPGYQCEAHHVTDHAITGHTDVDELAFACGPNHKLVGPEGWTTRRNHRGQIEWIPPAHLDHGQPRINQYHHPEKLLRRTEDDDDPEDP